MASVEFKFDGRVIIIRCYLNETMKQICLNFAKKIQKEKEIDNFYFLYNGYKINEFYNFEEQANQIDKKRCKMNILAYKINKSIVKENFIKSNEVICPVCKEIKASKENIRLIIKDYKINLFDCKYHHTINNLLINEYEKTQYINKSKIECNLCGNLKNSEIFYTCLNCNADLCIICESSHNKKHKIINYELKNYQCFKHNDFFIKYCEKCKINLCLFCESEHYKHQQNVINFDNIMPIKDNLTSELNHFREKIKIFNNNIDNIINKLNKVKEYMKIFYKISNDSLNSYEIHKKNYEILKNIKEFDNFIKNTLKDLDSIIDDDNIFNKMKNIINIYNKMTKIDNNINNDQNVKEVIGCDDNKDSNDNNDNYNDNNNNSNKNNNNQNSNINNIKMSRINEVNSNNFSKEPQNLEFKINITDTNESYGSNDIFEVFNCYKDKKVYVVSKNKDNNLEIYGLSSNNKINTLKGHENKITTIRYFICPYNNNEYLISGDDEGTIIIWEINYNYNIKIRVDT